MTHFTQTSFYPYPHTTVKLNQGGLNNRAAHVHTGRHMLLVDFHTSFFSQPFSSSCTRHSCITQLYREIQSVSLASVEVFGRGQNQLAFSFYFFILSGFYCLKYSCFTPKSIVIQILLLWYSQVKLSFGIHWYKWEENQQCLRGYATLCGSLEDTKFWELSPVSPALDPSSVECA